MNFIKDFRKIIFDNSTVEGIRLDDCLNDIYYVCSYIDIKNRWFINTKEYRIITSSSIHKKIESLSTLELTSYKDIKYRLQNKIPIVSYLSARIDKSEIGKSDWLLKNFGIYHCHLEEKMPNGHFKRDSNNLLFFCGSNDAVYLIDIKNHPTREGWLDVDLLKVIEENGWLHLLKYIPDYTVPSFDAETTFNLSKMSTVYLNLNHGVALSNLDLTCNSFDAVNISDYWIKYLSDCQKWCENDEELHKMFPNVLLDFELVIEDNSFVIYEPNVENGIKIKLCKIPNFMYYFKSI